MMPGPKKNPCLECKLLAEARAAAEKYYRALRYVSAKKDEATFEREVLEASEDFLAERLAEKDAYLKRLAKALIALSGVTNLSDNELDKEIDRAIERDKSAQLKDRSTGK